MFEDDKKTDSAPQSDDAKAAKAEGDKEGTDQTAKPEGEGEEGAQPEGEAKPAKRSKKNLIIIIGIVLVLLSGAGGLAYFLFKSKQIATDGGDAAGGTDSQKAAAESALKDIMFRQLDEIIVNLNTENRSTSFMKLKITLELEGRSNLDAVNNMMPRISDIIQVYLRELRPQDMQGSMGLYRLKEELLIRINKVLYPASIDDILFDEVLIQ